MLSISAPKQPSLIDTLPVWLDTPVLAYAAWSRQQHYRPSSQRVYSAMFSRFCQWLAEHHLRLDQASSATIRSFLDSPNPNLPVIRRYAQTSRQRQQYVRLLERVYVHLGKLGWSGPNPGRQAGVERVGTGADKPARFLTRDERQAVIDVVQERLEGLASEQRGADAWLTYRDVALIGVTLGGGLKPRQISELTLNCIKLDEEVIDNSVEAHAHRARLLPFAVEIIAAWIEVREMLSAESLDLMGRLGGTADQWRKSQLVFIADRSGNGYGRFSSTQGMHLSSIFRRIQGVLESAGVTGSRASPQTLRNTYAAMLIEGGASTTELVTCLGLSTEVTAQRIRASWAARIPRGRPM